MCVCVCLHCVRAYLLICVGFRVCMVVGVTISGYQLYANVCGQVCDRIQGGVNVLTI